MFSEDDDIINTRRNLNSIFDSDSTDLGDASGTKDKQRSDQQRQSTPNKKAQVLSTIIVKVVQSYVLENNTYKSEGKLGAAILGNSDARHFRLILYKDKSTHITQAQITANFWFSVQQNNYATFYDKNNSLWSILFEETSDLISFCIEVALARWSSSEVHDTILAQDLVTNKNDKTKEGDRVNIAYTAWPMLPSNKIGKEFETKGSLTTLLSSEKSWEKSLIGVAEESKRVLIIPALLLESWETTIGRRCSEGLLLQITIEKCPQPIAQSNVELVLPALPTDDFSSSEVDRKKKHSKESNKKHAQEKSSSKQDLITRMGKLGKPMLPMKGARMLACDSDETEEDTSSTQSEPADRPPKPKLQKPKNKPSCQTVVAPKSSFSSIQDTQIVATPTISYPMMTTYTPVAISPVDTQILGFLSEQRIHNSEIRMGLGQVFDKLEKVVDKATNGSVDKVIDQLKRMEQQMLSQFTIIHQQNSALDNIVTCDQRSSDKIVENALTDKETEQIELLEIENNQLRNSIDEENTILNELKANIDRLLTSQRELEMNLLSEQTITVELKKDRISTIQDLNSKLHDPYKFVQKVETAIDRWTTKVHSLEKTLNQLIVDEDEGHETSDNESLDSKKVMEKMNILYRVLKSKFKPGCEYSTSEIHRIFGFLFKKYIGQNSASESGFESENKEDNVHSHAHGHGDSTNLHFSCDKPKGFQMEEENLTDGRTDKSEDSSNESRHLQPPPPPAFDEIPDENDDEWLQM